MPALDPTPPPCPPLDPTPPPRPPWAATPASVCAASGEAEGSAYLVSDGRIVSWLPADGDDPPLWHLVHHDGDEEDLEGYEAEEGIAAASEGR